MRACLFLFIDLLAALVNELSDEGPQKISGNLLTVFGMEERIDDKLHDQCDLERLLFS